MSQKRIVGGRYELGDLLGRGGMGDVYRAQDINTGEQVAIKVLHQDAVAASPQTVDRFKREGEALRQLNHPHIVKILASFEEDGQHYLVMEYVGGGSLADMLHDKPRLPVQRVLEIGLDLADALTRAHRLNIIHRDIKPANVLLAEDGTPRLTDFGIARLGSRTRMTDSGMLMGTYHYLSPEAVNGEEVDARTDIWSFGVLLYEMLAGRLPFDADNPGAVLVSILQKAPADLREYRPNTPPELVDLIQDMLQKDRSQRISSVRMVGARLEALLYGASMPGVSQQAAVAPVGSRFSTPTPIGEVEVKFTTPPPTAVPAPAPKRTFPRWGFGLVGVAVIALLALGIGLLGNRGDQSSSDQPPAIEPVAPGEYMILVTQLEPVNTAERPVTRAIIQDLTRTLEVDIPFSPVRVREYPRVITSAAEAQAAAESAHAAVIVWGSYTDNSSDVELSVGDLSVFPFNQMDRVMLERSGNLRLRLTDPREQSIAFHVLWVLTTLQNADGDAYGSMLTNAGRFQYLRPAAEISDNGISALTLKAISGFRTDEEQAFADIDQAIVLDPSNPLLYIARANINLWLGYNEKAHQDAESAQRLGPSGWALPLMMFASLTGERTETINYFTQVIEQRPGDWFPLFLRGVLSYFSYDYARAQTDLEQAIALQPPANFPYIYSALLALRQGRLDDAQTTNHLILTEFPDPVLMSRLVIITLGEQVPNPYGFAIETYGYLLLGQYQNAADSAAAGLAVYPWYSDLSMLRGIAYCALGEYDAAASSYTLALMSEQNLPLAHLLRAETLLQQEKAGAAAADFDAIRAIPAFEPLIEAVQTGELTCSSVVVAR